VDISTISYRQGSIKDFDGLQWSWNKPSITKDIYMNRIEQKVQEIWVAEYKDMLIGELHLIWVSEDMDEANGINRAYLFSYRIQPEYKETV